MKYRQEIEKLANEKKQNEDITYDDLLFSVFEVI